MQFQIAKRFKWLSVDAHGAMDVHLKEPEFEKDIYYGSYYLCELGSKRMPDIFVNNLKGPALYKRKGDDWEKVE